MNRLRGVNIAGREYSSTSHGERDMPQDFEMAALFGCNVPSGIFLFQKSIPVTAGNAAPVTCGAPLGTESCLSYSSGNTISWDLGVRRNGCSLIDSWCRHIGTVSMAIL